jgi:hypothetical protein
MYWQFSNKRIKLWLQRDLVPNSVYLYDHVKLLSFGNKVSVVYFQGKAFNPSHLLVYPLANVWGRGN